MKYLIIICVLFFSVFSYSQSVGINTTTPDPNFKLDVNGPVVTSGLKTAGPTNYVSIFDQSRPNTFFKWQATGGFHRLSFNTPTPFTKNLMVIDSLGKVGIGTANPTSWFDVNNSLGGEAARFNGGNGMWLTLAENGFSRGYIGSFQGSAEDVDFGTYGTNATGKLHLATGGARRLSIDSNGDVFLRRSASTRSIHFTNSLEEIQATIKSTGNNLYLGRGDVFTDLTIDADGNVGIGGEIIPASQLHVVGGEEVSLTENGSMMLGIVTLANIVMDENEIQSRNNGNGADLFVQHNGGNLLLCGNEGGAVGIGVGSASGLPAGSLLAVDGKITCEEVLVKLSQNWPDYVFADDYTLPDLKEVKSFIQENKHLPGIPRAIDIDKEGLHVGEVQRKMMEKIEELTLYVIKLQEEIETLKRKQ